MADWRISLSARLEAMADALTAGSTLDGLGADETGLLRYLGYDDGDRAKAAVRARMLRAAAKLDRLFLLPVPDSPGLVFFGGIADPGALDSDYVGLRSGNLAGSGLSPERAFESCVGEGVEYLSQFLRPGDRIERDTRRRTGDPHADAFIDGVLAACNIPEHQPLDWIAARRLSDEAEAWFPVDLCLRRATTRQDFAPPLKLSTGCAAGPSFHAAAQRAILELIERDAVALWWRGGRRARPVDGDSNAGRAAAELWDRLRQGSSDRNAWLLDITTDIGIPVVAAISANQDGYGFAYGFGARMSLAEAARAAIFELSQVELGLQVVAAKRQDSGDAALNDSDHRQLRRGALFDTRSCALLQAAGAPAAERPDLPAEPAAALGFLVERLVAAGISAYALDLTRADFDIPVVRVLAPGLQLEPCQVVGERLASVIAQTGGGAVHTGGMTLL